MKINQNQLNVLTTVITKELMSKESERRDEYFENCKNKEFKEVEKLFNKSLEILLTYKFLDSITVNFIGRVISINKESKLSHVLQVIGWHKFGYTLKTFSSNDIYNELVLATIDCTNIEEIKERIITKFK